MATLSFRLAQYAQVFPLKPGTFCTLIAGISSTNKFATSLLFSSLVLSDSRSVLATLSSSLSFFCLKLLQIWQELRSLYCCSIGLHWVHKFLFFPGNNAADKLARREAVLVPSAIPCSLSSLTSHIHSRLSQTGSVLFHLNSSSHRFPRLPSRNLCFLVMLAMFSLVYAAMNTAYF